MSKSKIAKGQAAKKRMKEGDKTKKRQLKIITIGKSRDWTVGELLGMILKQST